MACFTNKDVISFSYSSWSSNTLSLWVSSFFISLNDFPGLCSSRFSKACGGYPEAFRVLSECINPINKKAHYTTCISFIYKDNSGKVIENCFEGKIEGEFVYPARGENGFGYDPTFLPNGYDKTFGELPNELRITINHRALALQKFFEFFKAIK